MSAGIEVKEFKHIPGKNDAEYIKLLEEHSERWKQIANSAISKLKKMSAERPEIIHCKDCKYWKEKPLYTYCEKMYRMGILDVLDYATEENDFCSMAEKRGEADDEVGS